MMAKLMHICDIRFSFYFPDYRHVLSHLSGV